MSNDCRAQLAKLICILDRDLKIMIEKDFELDRLGFTSNIYDLENELYEIAIYKRCEAASGA